MEPELKSFMTYWGDKFVAELKAQLLVKYNFAPGFMGTAYGEGRNPAFQGSASKYATGNLFNSISSNITDDGLELLMLDYWEWVNYGRAAGKYVPIKPLEEWATTKGFTDPRGAAFGISTNIKKFGIAPTNFYETAIDNLQTQFDEELTENVERSFTMFFDNLLENTIPSQK